MRKRITALGAVAVLVLAGAGCSEGTVFSLEEGTCFQEPENLSEVAEVETVDCDDRHFAEVFHVQEVEADGDDFPGDSVIAEQATEACLGEAFEDFTGVPFGGLSQSWSTSGGVGQGVEQGFGDCAVVRRWGRGSGNSL